MTKIDVGAAAATADNVLKDVMEFEPTMATMASMFIPGAAPIIAAVQPEVMLAAPFVEQAFAALAKGNGGDLMTAFIALLEHLSPAKPNAPALDGGK